SSTDPLGHYSFSNVVPGTYTVAEVIQPGWQQTAPPTGTYDATVLSGQVTSGLDFGNKQVPVPPNRPPVITSTAPDTALVGHGYRYNVTVTDPDGDPLQFDLPVKPDGMAVDPETGVIVWTPTDRQTGLDRVILRVQDGKGGSVLQSFLVTVTIN